MSKIIYRPISSIDLSKCEIYIDHAYHKIYIDKETGYFLKIFNEARNIREIHHPMCLRLCPLLRVIYVDESVIGEGVIGGVYYGYATAVGKHMSERAVGKFLRKNRDLIRKLMRKSGYFHCDLHYHQFLRDPNDNGVISLIDLDSYRPIGSSETLQISFRPENYPLWYVSEINRLSAKFSEKREMERRGGIQENKNLVESKKKK